MKFILQSTGSVTTLYIKERFKRKELVGSYAATLDTILKGLEKMFLDIGCKQEDVTKMMDSAKYEPIKGDKALDIQDGKTPGTFKIRELKWFLNFPYYKTLAIIEAKDTNEIIKVIVDSMPGYMAIDFKTGLPLNLDKEYDDNRRTTSTDKKKRSRPRNSKGRKLAVQKSRSNKTR